MTVSTTSNRQSATGDGSTTSFAYTFRILQAADMDVYKNGSLQATGYTVNIDSDGVGGTVVFGTAPANGDTLLFIRTCDFTQETALPTEGNLPETTIENVFDKLTMLAQQVNEKIGRALTLLTTSTKSGAFYNEPTSTLTLPVWNNTDSRFEFVTVASAVNNALPALGGGNVVGPGPSVTDYAVPSWNGTGGLTLRSGAAPGTAGRVLTSQGVGAQATFEYPTVDARVGGRLTLTTGVPVTTADVTAAGTIYYTPYKSRTTWLRYAAGTNVWKPFNIAELSLALTLTNGLPYDVFIEATSETAAQLVLVAWTNTTTRATALAYDATSGFLVKSDSTSKLYLGTIYATNTNQTEDSAARRMVWNYYNRVMRPLYATDTTNTWTYNTAAFRSANANTTPGVGRTDFVIGVAEDLVRARYHAQWVTQAAAHVVDIGIAIDSTTVPNFSMATSAPASTVQSGAVEYQGIPAIGYHFMQNLEKDNTSNVQFRGDNGGTVPLTYQTGHVFG